MLRMWGGGVRWGGCSVLFSMLRMWGGEMGGCSIEHAEDVGGGGGLRWVDCSI